jgi:8-oxo-dGTP pyrophosphatase MutT (NUDIX family)
VDTHKGQIAFPGGHAEPEELDQPEITALRETEEEVGISRDKVKLMGRLPPLFTGTGYLIQPFVGVLNGLLEETSLVLDTQETAEAIWAPLQSLLTPGTYQAQTFRVGNVDYPIDVYQYLQHRIWGATGSMTKNLLDRLDRTGISIRD